MASFRVKIINLPVAYQSGDVVFWASQGAEGPSSVSPSGTTVTARFSGVRTHGEVRYERVSGATTRVLAHSSGYFDAVDGTNYLWNIQTNSIEPGGGFVLSIEGIIDWATANPFLAGGIGIAAYLILFGGGKRRGGLF